MKVEDLHKTKITDDQTGNGYELSFTDPEWGDNTYIAHVHFDAELDEAKKGAALFRASYQMQQALKAIKEGGNKLFTKDWDLMIAALALSENTNETI